MSLVTVKSTGYGLRHKGTGKMARLIEEETDGNGYSNEYKYRLYDGEERGSCFHDFEVEKPEQAALALVIDTPWYNSTKIRPSWDGLDMSEYEVVEVTRISSVETKPCDVPIPVTFARAVEERRTMRSLAERYLGHAIPDEFGEKSLSFVVVSVPEGETVESIKAKCRNQPVLMSTGMGYPELCLGAFDLPEEYVPLFTKGPGVGLILTHFTF